MTTRPDDVADGADIATGRSTEAHFGEVEQSVVADVCPHRPGIAPLVRSAPACIYLSERWAAARRLHAALVDQRRGSGST
jgi:hypothetical protein